MTAPPLRLRNDNVLVRLDPNAERVLASGLVATATADRPIDGVRGTVLAVGPGHYVDRCPVHGSCFVATTVRAGDRVLCESRASGDRYKPLVLGDDMRIVRESELLAIEAP